MGKFVTFGISTSVVAVGITPHDQFPAVPQFVLIAPVHVLVFDTNRVAALEVASGKQAPVNLHLN